MVGRGLPQGGAGGVVEGKAGEEGRGRGKGEEAAVTSVPGPEEASSACSPLWLEPQTIRDVASARLTLGSPAPYL